MVSNRFFSCSHKPPHNTFTEVTIGSVSIMFSYGKVVGYEVPDEAIQIISGASPVTQRHLNKWRNYKLHHKVSRPELLSGLSRSLLRELTVLSAAQGETPVKDSQQLQAKSLDDELEELDDLEDDDDDLDDDDDEDDLDDDFDDDDEDEEDDLDDDLVEDTDESDPDYRNKY